MDDIPPYLLSMRIIKLMLDIEPNIYMISYWACLGKAQLGSFITLVY